VTTAAELREMVDEELLNRLAEAKQELFNLRFQHVTGQLDNYARLGEMKKEVARINTILRDREITAAEAAEAAEVNGAQEATGA
jgi:large subunit ribosomal protein L29